MTSDQTQLLLRLPTQLKADLQRHATAQGRKLTQEVVIRLTASLAMAAEQGVAPISLNYASRPMATVMHTNDPAHGTQHASLDHHVTAIDAAMLKMFKAMPHEKQLSLLTLLK